MWPVAFWIAAVASVSATIGRPWSSHSNPVWSYRASLWKLGLASSGTGMRPNKSRELHPRASALRAPFGEEGAAVLDRLLPAVDLDKIGTDGLEHRKGAPIR